MVATGLGTGDGGLSEYVRVKNPQLYPLPQSLSFTQGALVEPAACAAEPCTWARFSPATWC
jgi:(R,R)-butanediol dehydrogenase/meso-butanediol dehydrogenase/diacetyl reductase